MPYQPYHMRLDIYEKLQEVRQELGLRSMSEALLYLLELYEKSKKGAGYASEKQG